MYNDWVCGAKSGTSDKDTDDFNIEQPEEKFNIKAGKITAKERDGTGIEYADGNIPEYDITLEWKTITPNFPPKPEYAL